MAGHTPQLQYLTGEPLLQFVLYLSVIVNDMSCNRVEETLGNTLFIH